MLVEDPDVDVSHDQFFAVAGEDEVGAEAGVALARPEDVVLVPLYVLYQLRPGAVVPDQVRVLTVDVDHLQKLNKPNITQQTSSCECSREEFRDPLGSTSHSSVLVAEIMTMTIGV